MNNHWDGSCFSPRYVQALKVLVWKIWLPSFGSTPLENIWKLKKQLQHSFPVCFRQCPKILKLTAAKVQGDAECGCFKICWYLGVVFWVSDLQHRICETPSELVWWCFSPGMMRLAALSWFFLPLRILAARGTGLAMHTCQVFCVFSDFYTVIRVSLWMALKSMIPNAGCSWYSNSQPVFLSHSECMLDGGLRVICTWIRVCMTGQSVGSHRARLFVMSTQACFEQFYLPKTQCRYQYGRAPTGLLFRQKFCAKWNSGGAVESLDFSASEQKPIAKVVTLLEACLNDPHCFHFVLIRCVLCFHSCTSAYVAFTYTDTQVLALIRELWDIKLFQN